MLRERSFKVTNTMASIVAESIDATPVAGIGKTVALSTLQGNVLKGFGRNHSVCLFVRFDAGVRRGNAVLRGLVERHVTTAEAQDRLAAEWRNRTRGRLAGTARPDDTGRDHDGEGDPVGMFGLMRAGYEQFAVPGGVPLRDALGDDIWAAGMQPDPAAVPPYYWKPDVSLWEDNYREEMHAFFLIAADSEQRLMESRDRFKRELSAIGECVAEERGMRLKKAERDINPLGFADGVSKPEFPAQVFTREAAAAEGLAPEPGYGCFGTFLKIELNPLRFQRASRELSRKASEAGAAVTPEQIQELAAGRRIDGSPLVRPADGAEFELKGVSHAQCPFHAHARVMNGRDGQKEISIIRRGMVYGSGFDWTAGDVRQLPPSAGTGLLFLSFQRSLRDFTALIRRAEFRGDPILASPGKPGAAQQWEFNGKKIEHSISGISTIRGGTYFYVPSMEFLSRLTQ